jgi:release factor glutamine methyltransferase
MSNEPEAYQIGNIPFLGLTIWLEWWSEELVCVMKKVWPTGGRRPEDFLKGAHEFRVLDLCAGSGAIGCALLKYVPNAKVYFGEIDERHEATILKNIRENNLDASRAEIKIGDLFEPFGEMRFDFITTNPPYIPDGRVLDPSVTDFEPTLALRAGVDGLAVIRRIAGRLSRHLKKGGVAWVECDIENIEEARALFERAGLKTLIKNDQYKRPRIVMISF